MLDNAIKAKFKPALYSCTSIHNINACYWKAQRVDKKIENYKFNKKQKTKPTDSQATILLGTNY